MDSQPTQLPLISVGPIGLLAKPSPADDFQFDNPSHLPEQVRDMARRWLQVHAEAGGARTVAMTLVNGDRWLFKAGNESRQDRSGRVMCYLVFGRLHGQLKAADIPKVLQGAITQDLPPRAVGLTSEIPIADTGSADRQQVRRATVALALGLERLAVVDSAASAEAVMGALEAELDFVGIVERRVPRLTEGTGIVISKARWVPTRQIDILTNASAGKVLPPLGFLMTGDVPPQRRVQLFSAALDLNAPTPKPEQMTGAELSWLLKTPSGRGWAIDHATQEQIADMLRAGELRSSDLDSVKEHLLPEHGPAVAELLYGESDAFNRFVELFGRASEGSERLLPEPQRTVWSWLSGEREMVPERVEITSALPMLSNSGILDRLSLVAVARVYQITDEPRLAERFRAALVGQGMPSEVAHALFAGEEPVGQVSASPAPEPDSTWLAGLHFDNLLAAGRWAARGRQWRRWWTQCVRQHPLAAGRDPFAATAPWSSAAGLWLSEAARDGEIARDQALQRIARWCLPEASSRPISATASETGPTNTTDDSAETHRSDSALSSPPASAPAGPFSREQRPSREQLRSLLRDVGIHGSQAFGFLCGEPRFEGRLSPSDEEEITFLVKASVLKMADLVRAAKRGFPLRLLAAAGVSDPELAMLDLDQAPPTRPPGNWDIRLAPVLSQLLSQPEFWSRWRDGISPELLGWMAEQVADREGGTTVAAAQAALAETAIRKLTCNELGTIAGCLPGHSLCRQALVWSRDRSGDAEEALKTILAAMMEKFPALASWLRGELLESGPTEPPPHLSCLEMVVLIDLLHPTRDVLRVVMARDDCEPGEPSLLGQLSKRLRSSRIVPLSTPMSDAARRRPDWVAEIASLPGWSHWQEASQANPGPTNDGCQHSDHEESPGPAS